MKRNMIKLGDVATYINGYAFKPEDRGEVGLPIIRIQDLTGNAYDLGFYNGDYPKRIEINDGDVLISWSASLGVYVWNRGRALLNQHIFKVQFDKVNIDESYFVYAVRQKLAEMAMKTHGATMKHIVKKDFEETLIPYPSLKKQIEIGTNLDKIANIIVARKQQLELLDELVKARFVEMFGDPVLNDKKFSTLSGEDFFKLSNGKAVPEEKRHEVGIPAYGGNGISWYTNEVLRVEDTLVVGRVGFQSGNVHYAVGPLWITDNAMYISQYDKGKINLVFLCELMQRVNFSRFQDAGDLKKITQKPFMSFQYILPSMELQQKFVDFKEQIDKSKVAIKKSLDETQILFDSLMQKYFG